MTRQLSARERTLLWLAIVISLAVRVATLAAYPLLDPSESRYAEIARKMLETGDWLTPQFDYGVPFWGKPPLTFWLVAGSMRAFGVNEFAARLPSLLLMVAVGVVVWRMAARHAGRDAGLVAAAVFATMGLVFLSAGTVLTDIPLVLGTTLSMAGFWRAVTGGDDERVAGNAELFAGLVIGLLAKGPVAAVLTFAPLLAWTILQRAWGPAWQRVHWFGGTLLVVVAVVPWYAAAERATPGFIAYFLVGEHWQRFTQPGWTGDRYGTGHAWPRGSIWLFWLIAAAPWSAVMLEWCVRGIRAQRASRRTLTGDPFWRYLAAWTLAPMLFFTLSRNVLPFYVLPGLPAFALLIAFGQVGGTRPRPIERAERSAFVASALLAGVFLAAVIVLRDRLDRDYAQRALVHAFVALRGDSGARLVYYGDTPVSAEFYTAGQVQHAADPPALRAYLTDTRLDFFAIRERDAESLPSEQRTRLAAVGRFGRFDLYRELPQPR